MRPAVVGERADGALHHARGPAGDGGPRARRRSQPPSRSPPRISRVVTMLSVWTCLVEFRQMAASSWSARDSGGMSWAETGTQWKATSSSASATRAIPATSESVDRSQLTGGPCRGPRSRTRRCAAYTWRPSSGRSCASVPGGQRVARRRARHRLLDERRRAPGRSRVRRSTVAPCAAQMSRALIRREPDADGLDDLERGLVDAGRRRRATGRRRRRRGRRSGRCWSTCGPPVGRRRRVTPRPREPGIRRRSQLDRATRASRPRRRRPRRTRRHRSRRPRPWSPARRRR